MDAAARKTHPWWYRRLFKSGLEGPTQHSTQSRLPTRQARHFPQTQPTPGCRRHPRSHPRRPG
eukprot:703376-Prymnesium_polylepis.1